jgi:hypothetical protein
MVILAEYRHALARIDYDLTACRVYIAGKNLQKSGFTGAIGANYAVTISGYKFYVDFVEKDTFSKLE